MQFITLKYFPLALCFFSWDFWAGEMFSFVFIFEGKHHAHKGDREGGGTSHCKYMNVSVERIGGGSLFFEGEKAGSSRHSGEWLS